MNEFTALQKFQSSLGLNALKAHEVFCKVMGFLARPIVWALEEVNGTSVLRSKLADLEAEENRLKAMRG